MIRWWLLNTNKSVKKFFVKIKIKIKEISPIMDASGPNRPKNQTVAGRFGLVISPENALVILFHFNNHSFVLFIYLFFF